MILDRVIGPQKLKNCRGSKLIFGVNIKLNKQIIKCDDDDKIPDGKIRNSEL